MKIQHFILRSGSGCEYTLDRHALACLFVRMRNDGALIEYQGVSRWHIINGDTTRDIRAHC